MLTDKDFAQLQAKGIARESVDEQLRRHATGFPFLEIKEAATVENGGIKQLDAAAEDAAIARWHRYLEDGGTVCKFVPASGAASRMFKALYAFADGDEMKAPEGSAPRQLLDRYTELPFIGELREAVKKMYGQTVEALLEQGRDRDIIAAIIRPEGMNYGNLPKGLLSFHTYPDGPRTPVEEHLTEGAQTAAQASGVVNLHFTVSADHRKLFEQKIAEAVPAAEARTGKKFHITLSEQKPSTDTLAANPDGTPFRKADGSLLFRPGGHGALIENLSDIDAAVVFIKNIDNVVPDSRRDITVRSKSVLAGYLIEVHDRIADLIHIIDSRQYTDAVLQDAVKFMESALSITDTRFAELTGEDLSTYIRAKLDRPLRVCGMVRNEGEPGGGPFITRNPDGSCSPQILESTQIAPVFGDLMARSTHFNPVDLVCYIRDVYGKPYKLTEYVDPDTGFISSKSSEGRELKALELPGLWNGAMSNWNTVFVEVPAETFNPVKTVNDLLRPAHLS